MLELIPALYLMLWPPSLHDGGRWPIPKSYRARAERAAPWILAAVAAEGGDPLLLAAVGVDESGLIPTKHGRKDERGAWQIMPGGGAAEGCPDLDWAHNWADNARCAARYLESLRKLCGGPPENWVGLFNGGNKKCGPRPYAARVLAILKRADEKPTKAVVVR